MSGDDDERRHAQRLILVLPSSKFIGMTVDADDEAEGKHPSSYINQSKWMDYCATLEASRTPEIALDMQRMTDELIQQTSSSTKLTCTNSIAAMNIIYMEQMKYNRPTEQRVMNGLLGEDEDEEEEEEFLQPYIVSNPFEARELTTRWIDGWMDSNSWREVIHNTSAR